MPPKPHVSAVWAGVLVALSATTMTLQSTAGLAQGLEVPLLGGSPPSQVLVVSANVQECAPGDMDDMSELRILARRLEDQLPFAPDAVLLQEVKDSSARRLARLLSRRFGMRYALASLTELPYHKETRKRILTRDTAILLNMETMRVAHSGGYISTAYDRRDAASDDKPHVKGHAFLLAKERAGALSVSLASVHFVRATVLRSRDLADRYRARWSSKVARRLDATYPVAARTDIATIGGDFNSGRGLRAPGGDWRRMPFWTLLTGRRDFNDTVYVAAKNLPFRRDELERSNVDYIFSAGGVGDAASDLSYKADDSHRDPERFYSDHRFFWAIVGAKGLYFNQ